MILAINIGNTNVTVAFFNEDIKINRYSYKKYLNENDFLNTFESDILNIKGIKDIILSSVVPSLTPAIFTSLVKIIGIKPFIVDINSNFYLDYSSYDSSLIGIDRLLCCEAALDKYNSSIIVFDLGTAITVNVINNKGSFIGGAILPGVEMGLNALANGTALLPKGNLMEPSSVIGTNTAKCLISGAIYGTAAVIDGMSTQIEKDLGYKCCIIVTGGNAKDIIPYCNRELIYRPNLLLEGLLLLQRRKR